MPLFRDPGSPAPEPSGADRVRDRLAAQCSPGHAPKVTQYEDGSLLVDWPDGRAESFASTEAALTSAADRLEELAAREGGAT
jgi:hypothetical protein